MADSGLGIDLPPLFDRDHPESILPEIELDRMVFYVIRGGACVVEQLLNVELEMIACHATKTTEKDAGEQHLTAEDLVRNLGKQY